MCVCCGRRRSKYVTRRDYWTAPKVSSTLLTWIQWQCPPKVARHTHKHRPSQVRTIDSPSRTFAAPQPSANKNRKYKFSITSSIFEDSFLNGAGLEGKKMFDTKVALCRNENMVQLSDHLQTRAYRVFPIVTPPKSNAMALLSESVSDSNAMALLLALTLFDMVCAETFVMVCAHDCAQVSSQ